MAIEPIKITIEGVEKSIQSAEQLRKKLDEIKKIALEKNKITLDDSQAKQVLRDLERQASSAKNAIESIDKNVKFANFKAAAKTISTELVNIGAVAATSGKTAAQNISSIGGSVAGIASQFGFVGAAVGAALTLLTPFVAGLFEASKAEKEFAEFTAAASIEIAKETDILNSSIETLRTSTSNITEKKAATEELVKLFPEYLDGLDLINATEEEYNDILKLGNFLILERAVKQQFQAKKATILSAKVAEDLARLRKISELQNKLDRSVSEAENKRTAAERGTDEFQRDLAEYDKSRIDNLKKINDELEEINRQEQALLDANRFANQSGAEQATQAKKDANAAAKARRDGDRAVKPKDFVQFANELGAITNQVDELLQEEALDVNALTEAFGIQQILIDQQAKTYDNYTAQVQKAATANKQLEDSNKSLVKELNDVNKELEFEFDILERLARTGNTTDNRGINVIKSNGSRPIAEIQKELKALSDLQQAGTITLQEFGNRASEIKGIVLKQTDEFFNEQARILSRLNNNRTAFEANQKIIDNKDATETLNKIDEFNRKRLEQQKQFAKAQEDFFDRAAKALEKARTAEEQAAFDAGKGRLEAAITNIRAGSQKEIDAALAGIKPQIEAFNKQFGDLFSITDDNIVIDEQAISDVYSKGISTATAVALAQTADAARAINRTLTNINIKRLAEERNERIKFADEFIKIYKNLNAAELREFAINQELRIQALDFSIEDELDALKKAVKARKDLGEEQSQEEVLLIQFTRERLLEASRAAYEEDYKLQFSAEERALEQAKLYGNDVTVQQLELDKRTLEFKRKQKKEEEVIEKESNDLIEKAKKRSNADLIKAGETLVKQSQGLATAVVDIFNQNSQNIIDGLTEQLDFIEQRSADTLNRIASLEDDLEGKRSGRREAVLQSLEQQREIDESLAKEKIALAKKIEQEEIKLRKRQQAASIANAIINGALAVTQILAQPSVIPEPANTIYKAIQIGLSSATTAAQIGLIASQKFAKGGFTGEGSQRDETGHKVAGVVHNGEWVAPKWMVDSPQFGGMITQLEGARKNGFADGGFTSPDFNSLSNAANPNSNTKRLESMVQSYFDASMQLAKRPIYTKATEVATVAIRNTQRRTASTI